MIEYLYNNDGTYDRTKYDNYVEEYDYIDNDALNRLGNIKVFKDDTTPTTIYTKTFGYDDASVINGNASTRVNSVSYYLGKDYVEGAVKDIEYFYKYDSRGNIEQIIVKETNADGNIVEVERYDYDYDDLNQLSREDVKIGETLSYTKVFKYDSNGNVLSKKEYIYQPNVVTENLTGLLDETSYSYDTTPWKDQLDFFDGKAIAYDAMGNPIRIEKDDSIHVDLEWDGRQLVKYQVQDINDKVLQTVTYKYNDQGIRTYKKVETGSNYTEYSYYLEGDKVLAEKIINHIGQEVTTSIIYYTYDGSGKLISFNYDGVEYFYIRNIQGDITKIVDDTGKIVVSYTYDAWGNILATDDTSGKDLAKLNPYRYRGYKYDEETSLYYLNSRYYNSEWGRFINADGLIGETGDILGHNMFAYCQNNPVMYVDPNGTNPLLALGALLAPEIVIPVVIIVAVAVVLYSPQGQEAIRDGLQAGADAVGNAVDSISHAVDNLKAKINQKKATLAVAYIATITAAKKVNNGTYAIQFSDGKYYIGKGSPFRMYKSAMREGLDHNTVPVSFRFEWADSDREAFKKEYIWMVDYGYYRGNPDFYNRIWSPGRLYYFFDEKGKLYPGDYWGR